MLKVKYNDWPEEKKRLINSPYHHHHHHHWLRDGNSIEDYYNCTRCRYKTPIFSTGFVSVVFLPARRVVYSSRFTFSYYSINPNGIFNMTDCR